jgi:hypothetical protein
LSNFLINNLVIVISCNIVIVGCFPFVTSGEEGFLDGLVLGESFIDHILDDFGDLGEGIE